MEEFFYDLNRKSGVTRTVLKHLYGEDVANYSVSRLVELDIYPIEVPPTPAGKKVSLFRTALEKENEGPVYDIVDGKAIQRLVFIPEDPTQDSFVSLWTLLEPSNAMARIKQLAMQGLQENVEAVMLLNALTAARVGATPDDLIIQSSLAFFFPRLEGDEPAELIAIFSDCGLGYLLPLVG